MICRDELSKQLTIETQVPIAAAPGRCACFDYEYERITLIMHNLNTHSLGSLYEAFPPDEARRLINRLEVVHTPKQGSWLNMAEIDWKNCENP